MRKETALITGGAGFIGSHTADALAARGLRVRIVDNLSPPVHAGTWPSYVRRKGYDLIQGDVRDPSIYEAMLKGVDYVFHLAAYQDQLPDFSKFFEVNTVSTARIYETIAARQLPVKKVVLASTQFTYGDGAWACDHANGRTFYPELRPLGQFQAQQWDIICPHGKRARFNPFREDQKPNPTNSYGLSKVALEQLAIRLGKTYGIPTAAVRYSIVQGPRQSPLNMYSGALRIFVMQALAGEPITVYEDGNQLRDFVNVGDVVAANLLMMRDARANFEVFNVGGGRGYKIRDFARLVKRVTGSKSPIEISGSFRKTDTRHAMSDTKKLRRLGWRPQHTPQQSVLDYVAWFRAEGFDAGRIRAAQEELRQLGVVSR